MTRFTDLSSETPAAERDAILASVESLHRQLRPLIPAPYAGYLAGMFGEGVRMTILSDDEGPKALAVWRVLTTTYQGRRLYVDDLVTDQNSRSGGHGGALLGRLQDQARALDCDYFALDSGTHRTAAHRFYFRHGMTIASFAFQTALTKRFS
jgi:GNAT superfamily N-acetyltransferase